MKGRKEHSVKEVQAINTGLTSALVEPLGQGERGERTGQVAQGC